MGQRKSPNQLQGIRGPHRDPRLSFCRPKPALSYQGPTIGYKADRPA